MIAKAEKIAAGTTALRKARFLKVTGATKELDQVTSDRARQLAGLKGYVTNLPAEQMAGQVGDVALQAGQLPGPVDGDLVQLLGRAGDLQEPRLAQRGRARGDLL